MTDLSSPVAPPPAGASVADASSRADRSNATVRSFSPFLPLLILALAVLLWSGFQCYQLVSERQSLLAAYTNQQRAFDESGKLRSSLDALARETAILADRGNAGARLIVDELRKRGVTINPKAPPAGPDKNLQ